MQDSVIVSLEQFAGGQYSLDDAEAKLRGLLAVKIKKDNKVLV